MVWVRYNDNYSVRDDVLSLTPEQRWHLFCLIEWCCRNERWSGEIPTSVARRASDIDDADDANAAIVRARIAEPIPGGIRLLTLTAHIPPDPLRKDRERKRRERAHKKGDHQFCSIEDCPVLAHQAGEHSLCEPEDCGARASEDSTSTSTSISHRVPGPVPVPVPVPGGPGTVPDRSRTGPGHDDGLGESPYVNPATGEVAESEEWVTTEWEES